jgi:hypothetical protein
MPVWKNCRADILYYGDDAADMGEPCRVRTEEGWISVSYDDDGVVEYVGYEKGPGHYELKCGGRSGRATLHRFPNGKILEGFWDEEGQRGMWRIRLRE